MKPNIYPLISLANDAGERPVVADRADLPAGVVALVNDARLTGATYSESLTQYTRGYRDPADLLAAVDYIAPPVKVARRFDWKKSESDKDFLAEIDDERAIGAGFKRVEYAGTEQQGKTRNRGLKYILDRDEDGGVTSEEDIVAMLQQRIIRNKFRRAMTALMAVSAGSGAIFASNTQPDELMRAALETAQLATGVYPNRGLMGLSAFNLRKAAYAPQDNAGSSVGYLAKPADLAADLMLDDLRIDKSVYQATKTAKGRFVGSHFFGFHGHEGLSKDDSSTLKQFYTPVDGGGRFRVYRKPTGDGDKFVEIIVEHYEAIIATSTIGVARLNVTAS